MKFRFLFLLVISSFLLTACVSHAPQQANWPKDIPPRDYFVAHYENDIDNKATEDLDEYLLWVIRFYKGWELYSNGWTKVTEDALHGVKDPVVAQEIKTKMDLIGQGIASEWPKNKKDRRIFTRHIVVWGNALVEAIKRDQELPLINRVLADVNGLVAYQVAVDDIKAERYFPRDKGDDVFL
ncbi:hypothetical protein GCM10011613_11660 [Cellvibrio zantedeschiae]|uniref:Lipoprotein n=1 Tax=Cellvibrio zantedeschiae TaxID=1237077 RepID=A0ABQ3AVW8_9GAMM|nr:hypothetical protein [Cellvibrio zantedeschiae]GGY69013.1 hypothetical protein GCM10011613_11660 [Cellvibrio zantedeschiae]